MTPSVAEVLESIDRERVAVARALGIQAHTAREWLYLAYDVAGKTLLDAMRANAGYRGIQAPGNIQHRYVSEDVPASLVPISSIGEMLGVPTPTIRSIINLASIMHGVDYWAEGRTVKTLGIEGMSVKDICFLVAGTLAAEAAKPLDPACAGGGQPGGGNGFCPGDGSESEAPHPPPLRGGLGGSSALPPDDQRRADRGHPGS